MGEPSCSYCVSKSLSTGSQCLSSPEDGAHLPPLGEETSATQGETLKVAQRAQWTLIFRCPF